MITQNLSEFKKDFDLVLEKYFDEKISEAKKSNEISKDTLEILKEFTTRGGKRIRPALLYHSYLCFSDVNKSEAVKAGISIELVQSFLLIHDDIMDNDDFRRGKPTVHKVYSKLFNDKKLAESLAILCGDLAISLANESLLSLSFSPDKKIKAGIYLNEVVNKVEFGQELDIMSVKQDSLSEESLLNIHKLKTSKYTFEGPLIIGAILGGANLNELEILKEFSTPLGIAFQLQDDILGLFGDELKLGKPIGSDIREGKKTLLILKAKEKCTLTERKILGQLLGKNDITKEEVKLIQDIVTKSGSLDYSKEKIKNTLNEAKDIISKLKVNPKNKEFFSELVDYLSERDY